MTGLWLRRAFMAAACASAALLAGCGSSNTVSAITPARFIVFGDAFTDLGAAGTGKYTVNDGSVNNWVQQLASQYGRTVASTADGGTGYSRGNARVTAAVDAAGGVAPSITTQISTFLAAGTFGVNDVVVLNGGVSDVIVEVSAAASGAQTSAAMLANAGQAGRELAAQVRRLVAAGAKYVIVAGTYDLSRTPWGNANPALATLATQASGKFNDELLVTIVDLGANVLYLDAAFYYNLVTANPANYAFNNATTVVCTSVDPGPGIGTGLGKVNSSQCNTATVIPGIDFNKYVFADGVYTTPQAQRLFGDYAYTRMKARF
ncbi:MAG: GDSL family lipase [Comamonadaceae bacterium]|nr:MAG: GDSL family lipase [Comamonadaceae bacterium]